MKVWIFCTACIYFLFCQLSSGADINFLRSSITNHFSDTRNHEVSNGYKIAAREFIYQEFRKSGLEAEFHNFSYTDLSSVQFANVIGILKGTNFGTGSDRIIGLGAHYDTVKISKGVDDNGAGVAALLEVAKQLGSQNKKGIKRKNTVMFVSFDLEEYDYLGSDLFIQQWLNPWLLKNYGEAARTLVPHGIIVLDTMMEYNTSANSQQIPEGAEQTFQNLFPESVKSLRSDSFRGDFLAMIYRSSPDAALASSLRTAWTAESRPQFEFESFALPFEDVSTLNRTIRNSFGNFFRSDHYNFWVDNIPAIFLTDSANFRGDMISCYHHPCDDLDTMLTDDNLNFLGKTADSIARAMNVLSEPSDTGTSGSVKWTNNILLSLVLFIISLFEF